MNTFKSFAEASLVAKRPILSSFARLKSVAMRQWFDIAHRHEHDFCSVRGFLLAVRDCLRVKPGGLVWAGHPCNPPPVRSFMIDPQRSEVRFHVYGDPLAPPRHPGRRPWLGLKRPPLRVLGQSLTRFGNLCCARFCLIILLCISLEIHWVAPWWNRCVWWRG